MALSALRHIERRITSLHDLGYGNAYGELGDSLELVERIARGDSLDDLIAFCKEQDFDGYTSEEPEESEED